MQTLFYITLPNGNTFRTEQSCINHAIVYARRSDKLRTFPAAHFCEQIQPKGKYLRHFCHN